MPIPKSVGAFAIVPSNNLKADTLLGAPGLRFQTAGSSQVTRPPWSSKYDGARESLSPLPGLALAK